MIELNYGKKVGPLYSIQTNIAALYGSTKLSVPLFRFSNDLFSNSTCTCV